MEDRLVLALKSKKSRNRYMASTAVLAIVAIVFYLITYVFKTVPEDRIFTYTAVIFLGLAAFVYYGFLLVRILLLPSELIVLHEGELTIKGRIILKVNQVKDVRLRYGFGSSPKFSYGRLVINTKDSRTINVPEVEDAANARRRMIEMLGIE